MCVRLYRLVGRWRGCGGHCNETLCLSFPSSAPLGICLCRRMGEAVREEEQFLVSSLSSLILCFFSSWVGCGFGKNVREEFQY